MGILRRKSMFALMLATLACVPAVAMAENDADRVPADAVAYLHWAGTDAMGPAYGSSHMKGLFDAFKLQQMLSSLMEQRLSKMDPKEKEDAQQVHEFLRTLVHYPTSVYIGSVDLSNPDQPKPMAAIFSKMGAAKAGEFAQKLNGIIEPKDKDKVAVSVAGEYLLINIGADADMAQRLGAAPPGDGLGKSESFNKTMAQFGEGAAEAPAIVYINGESALHIVDDLMSAKGGRGARAWPAAESALGLTELKEIVWSGELEGADWEGQLFIGMGQNRTGLLDFIDNKPLQEDTLKLIPANATWAGVTSFDAARFMEDIRNAAGQIDARGQQNFDFALRQFFAFTGVDLRNDLIASAGNEFAYYAFPDANGKSMTNMVMATRLKNPQKMETSLSTLENTISAMIMQRNANSSVNFTTEALDAPNDKITAHILSFPEASPAWAIRGDVLYVGISKAAIEHAIQNAANGGSIAENPAFAGLKGKLGVDQISGFDYLDLPKVAPEEYPIVQHLVAEMKTPYTLPPLQAITPHLTPYLKVSWTDGAGYHAKSLGPFPFSGVVLSPYQVNMQNLQAAARERRLNGGAAPATQEKLP
ncbi:MAG: DUF3352 domain-containing protein [Phycisphaerae bacterium]